MLHMVIIYDLTIFSHLNPSTNLHSLDPNRSSAERSRKPSTFPGLEPEIGAQVFNTPTAVAGKVYYDTRKAKKKTKRCPVNSKDTISASLEN